MLNSGKATYFEDESIPFRFAIHLVDLGPGKKPLPWDATAQAKERTVTFTYGFVKANHGNYDFLTRYDISEGSPNDGVGGFAGIGGAQRADLCSADLAPTGTYCLNGTLKPEYATSGFKLIDRSVFELNAPPKPASTSNTDNFAKALKAALDRYIQKNGAAALRIDLFGGTVTGFEPVTYQVGQEVLATITVKFKAAQPNVLMAFGAHFSYVGDWKIITDRNGVAYSGGAGQSGSPFHIKVDQIDGTSVGALGNNVSGDAVQIQANLSAAKAPDNATVNAGDPIGFKITFTNSGNGDASGVTLSDQLPAGFTWSVDAQNNPPCSVSGTGLLTCTAFTVPAGGTYTVHVTAPTSATTACGLVSNPLGTWASAGSGSGTVTAQLTVSCPSLSITKKEDVAKVSAGTQIGFTVTVTNAGPGTANNVAVNDPLPGGAGISWSIASAVTGWSIDTDAQTGAQTLKYSAATLGATSSAVHVVSATTAASCATYENTATAALSNGTAPPPAKATVTVDCAQILVSKTADAASVSPGAKVGFVISVNNTGAGTATGVMLTDQLPAGLTWTIDAPNTSAPNCDIDGTGKLTCNIGTMGPIGSSSPPATVVVHVTATTSAANCGTITNPKARVTTTNDGSNETGPVSIFVACPALTLVKTATPSTYDAVGQTISYSYKVTNTGNTTFGGPVTVSDDKATVTCPAVPAGGLAPTTYITCAATYTIKQADIDGGAVKNTAQAHANGTDSNFDDETVTAAKNPALTLLKTATPSTYDAVGQIISYSYKVTNSGNVTLAGPVTVTDDKATVTCPAVPAGGLVPGAFVTCTASYTITQADLDGGSVKNTAQAEADGTKSNPDDETVTAVQKPALSIDKKTSTGGGTPADGISVNVGDAVTWTYIVKNTGNISLTNVTVTDDKIVDDVTDIVCRSTSPKNVVSGTLAVGASATCTATGTATAGAYTNKGTATATPPVGSSVTANDLSGYTGLLPKLSIVKTAVTPSVQPGGDAIFKVTVSNASDAGTAKNVKITDQLPAALTTWAADKLECPIASNLMTCTVGTLAAGATFEVQVKAKVPSDFDLSDPPTVGGFPINVTDGNLDGADDWKGAALAHLLACPASGVGAGANCVLDQPTGTGDDAFGQGTKEDSPIPSPVFGSIPNNKSDLTRFYFSQARRSTASGIHDFVYLAWERVLQPNGTTNMDFELNQNSTLSSNNATPIRTAGDVLIKYDLSKGGGTLGLGYHKWVTTGSAGAVCEASSSVPCWGKLQALLAPVAEGSANSGGQTDDILPSPTRTLDALTFGEASVDLQAAMIFPQNTCLHFGKAYLKSRSSDAFTSEIKDFIIPLDINITNCSPKKLTNTATVSADNFDPITSAAAEITVGSSGSASLNLRTNDRLVGAVGGGESPFLKADDVDLTLK